jgi:formylglycine-generating enzyme required for sulfatase activity
LEEVDGKSYYSHIVYKGTDLPREYAAHATFILIKPPEGSEVKAAFYIMQHKVSNRFFQAVLRAHRDKLPEGWPRKEWEKGAKNRKGDDLPTGGTTPEGWDYADFPAFRVSGNDAERFARLIGAHLPTADEWGVAAGYDPELQFDDQGPFQGKVQNKWALGEFALRSGQQGGAMPIGLAKRDYRVVETLNDKCVKNCYDLASNGFEWTATAVEKDNKVSFRRVPIEAIKRVTLQLGGQTYRSTSPLKYNGMFTDSEYSEGKLESELREADISFRVIIETDWPR